MTKGGNLSLAFFLLCLFLAVLQASCGGGGSSIGNGGNGIVVTISSPVGSPGIDQGQSVDITASVSGDSAGVTWSIVKTVGGTIGTLSNASSTGVTYNAPSTIASLTQVTVKATSVTDPSISAVVGISVAPPPVITTPQTSVPFAFVKTSFQFSLMEAGGTAPFTWSVLSGSLPTGLSMVPPLTSNTLMIAGKPATPEIDNFMLQVTDAAGVSATMPYTITVSPVALKVQVPKVVDGIIGVAYPKTALGVIGGVAPYTWSASLVPPGLSVDSSGVISGTPTTLGPYSFSVIVTDAQTPVPGMGFGVVNGNIDAPDNACHTGAEPQLSSQEPYAFLFTGFDANGPVVTAGSFTADGTGNITGGSEDVNRASGAQTNLSIVAAGSSYTVGPDQRGCLTLINSAGSTTTFRFMLGGQNGAVFTRGRMIEFDDTSGNGTRGSGFFRLQDSTAFSNAGFTGRYAFGFTGRDSAGGRFAMAGSTQASGGTLSSIAADTNDAGTLGSGLTGGSGTYNIASNGRGTGTFTVGPSTFNFAMYVVDAAHALFMTTDKLSGSHPIASGEAISAAGPFSAASLSDNHLLRVSALTSGHPDVTIGVLRFDGAGALNGSLFEDNGGVATGTPITGNYSVDTNTGRAAFSGAGLANLPAVAYVVPGNSGVTAFFVGSDTSVAGGASEFQVAGTPLFQRSAVAGVYLFGTGENLDDMTSNQSGFAVPDGGGNVSGIQDASDPGAGGLTPNQMYLSNDTVNTDGSGTFGGISASVTNGPTLFYIDESPLNLHPAITILEK